MPRVLIFYSRCHVAPDLLERPAISIRRARVGVRRHKPQCWRGAVECCRAILAVEIHKDFHGIDTASLPQHFRRARHYCIILKVATEVWSKVQVVHPFIRPLNLFRGQRSECREVAGVVGSQHFLCNAQSLLLRHGSPATARGPTKTRSALQHRSVEQSTRLRRHAKCADGVATGALTKQSDIARRATEVRNMRPQPLQRHYDVVDAVHATGARARLIAAHQEAKWPKAVVDVHHNDVVLQRQE
mmetsp:Transcript_31886/g.74576  ORF Transcript_31886/g.74576 Transcript_31886/m.74576 type:complete len:244 (+) Transcript_31886:679-1410(+)